MNFLNFEYKLNFQVLITLIFKFIFNFSFYNYILITLVTSTKSFI